MKMFLLNILLAVLWMAMWDSFDIWTLGSGLVLGYLVLGLFSRTLQGAGYGATVWNLLSFACYFIRILVKANLQVAWEVLTPGWKIQPRIVRYPVGHLSDVQLTALSSAISLTPGTLTVDVSDDQQHLYVHAMYARSHDDAKAGLDELHDRLMKEVF